ncbi:P-loop containing nucleoside triphosphate hydrolase protein [Tribonema minus]|uniref:P-loop containing nucleoside triphosphate hydrolase protein n=1 Tax=Tribonema minus TaxID=303371 RepID=A0A835YVA4_9STRA|nr:P-loop containing nucleoside triphosphate hydrolase protein [Tribonema minus]
MAFTTCTQQQCYEATVRPLVADCCAGYNVTAFAYGQTASGKTHTVFGSGGGEERGIAARVLEDLFDYVAREERDGGLAAVRVTLTFIEIYREEDLPLREDEGGGMLVAGALCEEVTCAEDAWQLLADGIARRATGSTFMNAVSSRSHAIATLAVERVMVSPEGRGNGLPVVTRSKFHLVDLAGTERADRTGATGMRFKESIKINQGLFTLGKVIRALSTPVGNRKSANLKRHVPYRESKLTRLLQDSLGGNSRTVMVACISPADADLQETVDTLKYATRARTIRNAPVINKGEVMQPPAMPSAIADRYRQALCARLYLFTHCFMDCLRYAT